MGRYSTFTVMLIAVSGLAGCNQVVKDTNDQSPPLVEIKVKPIGGSYEAKSSVQLSAVAHDQLDLMCLVTDANGVKSAALQYSFSVDGCNVHGASFSCVASYQPKPQSISQQLSGDANGKVVDQLPLLSTVKGPFTCQCPGGETGVPVGQTITATCTGSNWSSDPAKKSAQAVLAIELN